MRTTKRRMGLLIAGSVLLHACSSGGMTGAELSMSNQAFETTAKNRPVRIQTTDVLCLTIQNEADSADAALILAPCDSSPAQSFTLDTNGLIHVFNDMCLQTTQNGMGPVITAACTTSAKEQQWQIQGNTVVAAASAHCLSSTSATSSANEAIVTSPCVAGSKEQAWGFSESPNDPNASSTSSSDPTTNPSNASQGIVQSGNGWPGNVNIASNSQDYLGMSIDQLEASGAPIGKALLAHKDVEQAIRKVSQQTGVPSGLLAGICYQESSFDNNAYSKNPNPSSADSADVGITQAPLEDFSGTSWQDPTTNLLDFINKQGFLSGYKAHKSWGYVLRLWNSGEVLNPNNLGEENNSTDANYVVEILQNHCLGKD